MTAYYNENNPKMAQSLRELIDAGLIAPGFVDERSIEDVKPAELEEFTQHHFFAGIGVWSFALRLAGWPDERPVCTGSCPCQPFSTAGKKSGFDDERHLWPAWHWLISQFRPVTIFGEQVASKDARTWLDVVSTDLEGEGYTIGSAATVACGFGAPHKRQRLYWVADDNSKKRGRRSLQRSSKSSSKVHGPESEQRSIRGSLSCGMADDASEQRQRELQEQDKEPGPGSEGMPLRGRCNINQLGDVCSQGGRRHSRAVPETKSGGQEEGQESRRIVDEPELAGTACDAGPTNGFWSGADWIGCTDGKYRPVEPGTFPLVNGAAERVGRLSGYGNAIVAQQAQAFIEAYLEVA